MKYFLSEVFPGCLREILPIVKGTAEEVMTSTPPIRCTYNAATLVQQKLVYRDLKTTNVESELENPHSHEPLQKHRRKK